MQYKCRVSDKSGKITNQIIQAENQEILSSKVISQGLYLLSFEEKKTRGKLKGRQNKAVLELTQSLSLMIDSGLTLKESFEIATKLFTKGNTSRLVNQLNERLRKGESFSQAIEAQKELFPPLYLGMIRVGQKLGHLDQILPALSDWLEKRKELKDKIMGALLYPIMVLVLVFTGVAGLLFFFLPYMEEMMLSTGDSVGNNLNQAYNSARNLVFFFIAIIVIVPTFKMVSDLLVRKYQELVIFKDKIRLQIPFLKNFFLTQDMLSLSFALSVLTRCGVPLEDAILQASEVLENTYIKKSLIKIQDQLLKGQSLSRLIEKEKVFPNEFSRWVDLGESIGKTEKVFDQLRSFYQKEMDKILNKILTLAEPVVIMLLGVVLIIIILNVILPLLTLYGGIT